MKILILSAILLSFSSHAEVSKSHVDDMLQQMVRENVISAAEAEKAKLRMKNINKDQWKAINETALQASSRAPASVPSSNKIEEVNNIDLDGAQFKQIQDDVKKIVPEYKD